MKPHKTLLPVTALLAALFAGGAALAHSDDILDSRKAPNGGQLRMAGAYHYELVVARDGQDGQDKPVVVYVTDHAGAKVSTVGAGGTATLLAAKAKVTVTLAPDGDNRLKGVGKYAAVPDMKAVVSIALAGKAAEQARFTPLAPPLAVAQDAHGGHKH